MILQTSGASQAYRSELDLAVQLLKSLHAAKLEQLVAVV